ncbi:MAG: group III truncated hemoglobin [Stellaceae bacterium]
MTSEPAIGETDIALLVDRFYAKVRRDPIIGPLFNEAVADWDEHLATLRAFWSSVMLTSGRYKGNPLVVHMRQPIRPEFFDRWLALFGETAEEVVGGERAALFRTKANRIAESLKLGLFFRPGNTERRPRAAVARPQGAPQPASEPGPR